VSIFKFPFKKAKPKTIQGLPKPAETEPVMSDAQKEVMKDLSETAKDESKSKHKALVKVVKKLGFTERQLHDVIEHIRKAEMTINFEPDKEITIKGQKKTIAEVMMGSDHYMNAFEIGFSGGAPVDYTYTGRNKVEIDLFGYKHFSSPATDQQKSDRPKYIGLNLFTYAGGAATGSTYGESALVFKPYVRKACSITKTDSFGITDPHLVGTFDHFEHVLYSCYDPTKPDDFKVFFQDLLGQISVPKRPASKLHFYWEVQVHCTLRMPEDVVYIRGSFQRDFGSVGGDKLRSWMIQMECPLIWGWQRNEMFIDPMCNSTQIIDYNPQVIIKFDDAWKKAADKKKLNRSAYNQRAEWLALWPTIPISMRYTPDTDDKDTAGIKKK
jgi:hypothetical protein